MNARHERPRLECPNQSEIDEMLQAGIDIMALAMPEPVLVAYGIVGADGRFEPHDRGSRWLALEAPASDDVIVWQPQGKGPAGWSGRAFALGEEIIDRPETCSFDCSLNIFADPIDWLRARRDGIVILPSQWTLAFDRLRDVPRIAIAERLLPLYRRHMKPSHLPELRVIPERRVAA